MTNSFLQLMSITADVAMFMFIGYYFFTLHAKEKELEKKKSNVDTHYHQIVDDALSRERKILDDATDEANAIISEAKHISLESRESMHQSLQQMVTDMQKETIATSQDFMRNYKNSLQELSTQSMNDFQHATKELNSDLQNQIKTFRETLFSNMQKELEAYKQSRLKQTEDMITRVVQKASQEIFNKSISLDDHHHLMIEALEKAKREGVFD